MVATHELRPRFESAVPKDCMGGHRKKVHTLQFNKSGSRLASGSTDMTVRVWPSDATCIGSASSSFELKGHANTINQLCWNPTSDDQLASCSYDRTVRVWDVRGGKSGQETHKIPTPGENINIAWSPCGTYIAVGNDKDQLSLIDIRKGAIVKNKNFKYEVNEFQFSPNSAYLLIGANGNGAGTIEVYSIPRLDRVWSMTAHAASLYCLKTDPTQTHLALGSNDGLVSIWDLKEMVSLRTVDRLKGPIRTLNFSYDGRFIASASDVENIDVAEVATGRQMCSIRTEGTVNSLAWHPRSLLLAWAPDHIPDPDRRRSREDGPFIRYIAVPDN